MTSDDEDISEVIMDIRRSPRPKVRKVRKVKQKGNYTCPYCDGVGLTDGPENLYSCHCEHCDGTGKITGVRVTGTISPEPSGNTVGETRWNPLTHTLDVWNGTSWDVGGQSVSGNLISVTGASSVTGTLSPEHPECYSHHNECTNDSCPHKVTCALTSGGLFSQIAIGFAAMAGGIALYSLYRNRMGR